MTTYKDLADEFDARLAIATQQFAITGTVSEDPDEQVSSFEDQCVTPVADIVFRPDREFRDEEMLAIFMEMPEPPTSYGRSREDILEEFYDAVREYVKNGVEWHAAERGSKSSVFGNR